jgi:hypothetical protein
MTDESPAAMSLSNSTDSTDTKPIRASEQLNWDKLAEYAREKLSAELGTSFNSVRTNDSGAISRWPFKPHLSSPIR